MYFDYRLILIHMSVVTTGNDRTIDIILEDVDPCKDNRIVIHESIKTVTDLYTLSTITVNKPDSTLKYKWCIETQKVSYDETRKTIKILTQYRRSNISYRRNGFIRLSYETYLFYKLLSIRRIDYHYNDNPFPTFPTITLLKDERFTDHFNKIKDILIRDNNFVYWTLVTSEIDMLSDIIFYIIERVMRCRYDYT